MSNLIRVIDHTTGKTYRSVKEAADALFISNTAISRFGCGRKFKWHDHVLELVETDIGVRSVPIQCIESGTVYKSIKAASEVFGFSADGIRKALKKQGGKIGGVTFRRTRK